MTTRAEELAKCENCRGTGYYGDNGPGIRGNNEYQICECKIGESLKEQNVSEFQTFRKTIADQSALYEGRITGMAEEITRLREALRETMQERDVLKNQDGKQRQELIQLRQEHKDVLDCAVADDPNATDGINGWAKRITQERDELKAWKDSQMMVESSWDAQAVGKLLGITLGRDIRKEIQPRIQSILQERDRLRAALLYVKKWAVFPMGCLDQSPWEKVDSALAPAKEVGE